MGGLWANIGGYSFHKFLVLWVNCVSVEKNYPGSLIKASDSVTLGMLYLGLAPSLCTIWWQRRKERERTQRIINSLKSSGAW